jgi:hypothetical protein
MKERKQRPSSSAGRRVSRRGSKQSNRQQSPRHELSSPPSNPTSDAPQVARSGNQQKPIRRTSRRRLQPWEFVMKIEELASPLKTHPVAILSPHERLTSHCEAIGGILAAISLRKAEQSTSTGSDKLPQPAKRNERDSR